MPRPTQDNLASLLQIRNATAETAELYFYGDIVSSWWGAWDDTDQYPEAVKRFLDGAKGKNLNIYINSGGGSVFAGMAIYNMLKRHTGMKTVRVDGLAASIASVIALAGDRLIIPGNAYFMIHKPLIGDITGNASELRKLADTLDTIEEGILNVYSQHLAPGVSMDAIRQMVEAESWLTGEAAAQYFSMEITAHLKAVAYAGALDYSKIPQGISVKSLDAYNARLNLLKLRGEER